ncbi:NAD(P)/FAD-dependent oxidoreductase [Chamaesiphon minutus]|uniref:NADH dehydrogenase, FAD-containing subunit n=1 Tax=Chamaesiphon minutus (strain ATCC 27169 / PCC 6605) TaxID=1173020 RepID=K9UBC6_CHAP6|nr:NAD(P)/FAD-dependent oxidoreductase [Chamaesiphon minutus]AFY92392.1 NADH dehydrogenase, FAD-containing subunit [Chamaesiphon minutus PCC 6605]
MSNIMTEVDTLDETLTIPTQLIAAQKLPTLILGGGFTGLFTALHLSHQHYQTPTILIDRGSRFIFKPLLYEFLSGEMNTQYICPRYDNLLHKSGIEFIQDTVQSIDLHQRQVKLASGLHYNYRNLVLSLGSVVGYCGVEGAKEHTLQFSSTEDAVVLAKHLRDCLQRATQATGLEKQTLLTFAIMGAGCTGIELAATLADLLPNWYALLGGDITDLRVVVIQRGQEILKGHSDSIRETTQTALQERNVAVELMLETEVIEVRPNTVVLKRNNQIEQLCAATMIWTAGTAMNPLIDTLSIPEASRDRHGQLKLTNTSQLLGFPEVFAGGDCTVMEPQLPATAQVAYQQGAAISHNLQALSENRPLLPVEIGLRGTLLKLGLDESVADLFDRYQVKGHLGHLIRQAAYVDLLPTPARNFKGTIEWLSDELFHYIAEK